MLSFHPKSLALFRLHHTHVRKATRLSSRIHIYVPEQGSLGMRPVLMQFTIFCTMYFCTCVHDLYHRRSEVKFPFPIEMTEFRDDKTHLFLFLKFLLLPLYLHEPSLHLLPPLHRLL